MANETTQVFYNGKTHVEHMGWLARMVVGNAAGDAGSAIGAAFRRGNIKGIISDIMSELGKVDWAKATFGKLGSGDPVRLPGNVFGSIPQTVYRAMKFYYDNVESHDWGSVSLFKLTVRGKVVYVVVTTSDEDVDYIEVFDVHGNRLATGMTFGNIDGNVRDSRVIYVDENLGDVRTRIVR
jgi:hypothetical protein